MTITYRTETIFPDKAQKMLDHNDHNRNLRPSHITKLAGIMRKGQWELNGESIKLNGTNVLDGQHRLKACIESDCAFTTLVIRGLPKHVQKSIDTGIIRTGVHHFEMEGESYPGLLAPTIAKIIAHSQGLARIREGISNISLEDYLEENQDIREFSNHYGSTRQRLIPAAIAAASHYIFSRIEPEEADDFMGKVIDGIGLKQETPQLCLREKLIKDMTAKRRIPADVKFALTVKTWNLHRRGVKCKRIGFRVGDKPEPFPRAQ
jgi:hypothetical protein